MNGRSAVGERCQRRALIEPQNVIDGVVTARGSAVREHVRADLREGRLEEHEIAVVGWSTGRLPQPLNRRVDDVQSVVEMVKGCMELKGRQDA